MNVNISKFFCMTSLSDIKNQMKKHLSDYSYKNCLYYNFQFISKVVLSTIFSEIFFKGSNFSRKSRIENNKKISALIPKMTRNSACLFPMKNFVYK